MALGFSSGDAPGFKLLLILVATYGLMAALVHSVLYMRFIKPLDIDAPLDRFSEARAVEHVRVLAHEIDGRQEGRPGLTEAARYITEQLEMIRERAGSNVRIEIEESVVNGTFNMMFLGHGISLGYRNHTNIVMRISSIYSQDNEPSVLLNGHFDSPLASPGAADCGSCVASMLEIARLMVDSEWVPPRPVIFLFNGAEELFLLGSHGFMKTHQWRETIGAFINVEASGTGGPDLVCQSGPGSWPSQVYAQSAVYPMAHSAAQDVFPVIPGDTDFRIFSQDYGNIPGLDIIFLLGGYFYHTSYDTLERLLFAHPYLAYLMFVPCSLVGMLIPRIIWSSFPLSQDASALKSLKEALSDEARFWGAFGLYAISTLLGMMGALPPPYGYFVPDVVMATTVGAVTGLCVGPLIPICGRWLARSSILQVLLHISVLGLALSSQFFPYSVDAPKRILFQHTFLTADANQVMDSSYDFSVVDSNSLLFVFKHAPEVAKELHISSELSFETAKLSQRENFMGIFPVSFLFSRSLKFPAKSDGVLKQYRQFPHLSTYEPHTVFIEGSRRVYLQLSLGSLEEVWVTVLNITGPLSSWSFADNTLPATVTNDGGPPSYICRLSGASSENWNFWLEARGSDGLRVDVAVIDQKMVDETKKLRALFPEWVDVVAHSSFLSSYIF
ncbi:hypothetical protein C1H46_017629 [Malus baccata]|uniref:Uncharacterized protein n=1 Tax=Malus baccata TaxID=106549 RepID=A0A540MDA8_MALBA|nr:hypothetical protein C1H46_017629 [Malus baccata]